MQPENHRPEAGPGSLASAGRVPPPPKPQARAALPLPLQTLRPDLPHPDTGAMAGPRLDPETPVHGGQGEMWVLRESFEQDDRLVRELNA